MNGLMVNISNYGLLIRVAAIWDQIFIRLDNFVQSLPVPVKDSYSLKWVNTMQNGLAILIVISSHLISYKTVATGLQQGLMQRWTPWRVIHRCFLPLIAIKNALAVSQCSHLGSSVQLSSDQGPRLSRSPRTTQWAVRGHLEPQYRSGPRNMTSRDQEQDCSLLLSCFLCEGEQCAFYTSKG